MSNSKTPLIEKEDTLWTLKSQSTLKLKTDEVDTSKKDWKRFFRKEFYSDKFKSFLMRFVKNENKELGAFFLKRKILLWVYLSIILVVNVIFFSTFHFAISAFNTRDTKGLTMMVIVVCVMILIWFFTTLFALFKAADKYSYRFQAFWKQLMVKIGVVNFSHVVFYLNDVRVPILTLRHKSIQFLEQTFRQFKTNDKQMFCLKYLLDFEQKIKQEEFVTLPSPNITAKNEDRVIPRFKKEVFNVLPIFKSKKTKTNINIKEVKLQEETITPPQTEPAEKIKTTETPTQSTPTRKKNRGNKQKLPSQPNTSTAKQNPPKPLKSKSKEHK